ncbi:NVEALA domain-containing protein [Phocaeicola coprophilus]|uniref:NVEALA domain-containing protein n=1 Tax=Phocaeicola coprophilus TaxID=387090 RepID=UPI001D571E8F|nr:NVEALA domain-containing protein [Phocaeicola coprophilus]HJE47273.1 NVEALA domain-containing protein [Phocaeicola coprophilus]
MYTSQKEVELSDLAKANVEALADGEIEVGPLCLNNWRICHIYSPGNHLDGIKVAN